MPRDTFTDSCRQYQHLQSFPTRRSSDLKTRRRPSNGRYPTGSNTLVRSGSSLIDGSPPLSSTTDQKSTRLNSSHVKISHAVFCLKKETNYNEDHCRQRRPTGQRKAERTT